MPGRRRSSGCAPSAEEGRRRLLADRLAGALTDAGSATAYQLSAGNPLLLEHLAAASSAGGPWPDPSRPAPPQLLVLARFAGLNRDALRYAQAASVLGVQFDPRTAATLTGLKGREASSALQSLCRDGLVAADENGLARFVHPLRPVPLRRPPCPGA